MNRTRKAFTLIELVTVVSIMILLSVLVVPAIQGSRAQLVSTSSAHVADMLESARQTAMLIRQPVAVAALPADSNSVQRFTTLKYIPATSGTNGTWMQISKWDALAPGILADSGADTDGSGNTLNAFQPQNSPVVSGMPALTYAGTAYQPASTYGYVIFLADGSLYQNAGKPAIPCILRVVEGITDGNGGIKSYTGMKMASGKPANYCDLVVNDATGAVKLVRP